MRRGVGKYIEDYAPSTLKALDGPHTSIGLILISIEGSNKKGSRDGLPFYSLFFRNKVSPFRHPGTTLEGLEGHQLEF
jgi:hypothetical protein